MGDQEVPRLVMVVVVKPAQELQAGVDREEHSLEGLFRDHRDIAESVQVRVV